MSNIEEFEETFGPPSFKFNDPAYAKKFVIFLFSGGY